MCYWIDSLVVGSASNNALNQPLISGLDDNNGHKDNVIYLNQANNFTSKTCNLKSISFGTATTIATPPYSFEGCEQLVRVKLPRVVGGHIPAGLFASIPNSNIVFEVPSDASGNNFVARDPGVLDLTYTGYTSIDAEAFKETNLTKVIAPITTDFTLEQDSFASCTSLTEFDFSNVTNSVVLNASFRGSTIPDSLFDFGSAAITFGAETFKGCTFTGTKTFSFPENTAIIGDYCFENCSTLENVTADAALTHMQRVVVDNGEGQNNAGNNVGFKQIGDYAFNMCTNLKNFDFSKFTQLERIGHFAFGMKAPDNGKIDFTKAGASNDACICTDGIVELPETLTNIGVGAFHTSKVTKVTFKSHSIKFERANDYTSSTRLKIDKNNGGSQFRFCYELTTVFFEDPDCAWTTPYLLKSENGQDNYFSKCTKLTAVFLPTGYDIQYERYTAASNNQNGPRPDSMVWESNSSVKFYVYHTVNDLRDDKPAINVFCTELLSRRISVRSRHLLYKGSRLS